MSPPEFSDAPRLRPPFDSEDGRLVASVSREAVAPPEGETVPPPAGRSLVVRDQWTSGWPFGPEAFR
jgi:hypothetical protein